MCFSVNDYRDYHEMSNDMHCANDHDARTMKMPLTHYQTTNFRLFQSESLQTTISKFTKNGRKLSKWVENTVGKGEIARYEQFLLFPQCFQKARFPEASKAVIVWEYSPVHK